MRPLVPVLFLLPGLFGCGPRVWEHRWFAMDTEFSAGLYGKGGVPADTAYAALRKETHRLENRFSDFLPSSDLKRVRGNRSDTVFLDAEMAALFAAAESLMETSRGRFDVTMGPLKRAYGLGDGQEGRVPPPEEIARCLRGNRVFGGGLPGDSGFAPFHVLPDGRLLLKKDSLVFDFGAIAKGYAVDRLSALLDSLGFSEHLLQAGGDMFCSRRSDAVWSIGIRHPRLPDSVCGVLRLQGPMAVSTSGDYERFFVSAGVRYHHILDPATGAPARPYCSVTALAPISRKADGLSTALFVLGPDRGREMLRGGAEALWIRENPDRTLCALTSPGFRAHLISFSLPFCPAPHAD